MKFKANEGKKIEIEVNGKIYLRHVIKTRFIKQGESYIDVFKEYVVPIYKKGDIISSSEKIIALCQNRVVKRADIKIGFWAKLLSKFASHPSSGVRSWRNNKNAICNRHSRTFKSIVGKFCKCYY